MIRPAHKWGEWGLRVRDKVLLRLYLFSNPLPLTEFISRTHKPQPPRPSRAVTDRVGTRVAAVAAFRSDSLSARVKPSETLRRRARTYRYGAIFKSAARPRSPIQIGVGTFDQRGSLNHG